jgi:putative two-component system response regulator
MEAEFRDNLLYAASMHDIGKVSIPDHILLKPGKLSPDEWKIMQQHTTVGAQMLSGSDSPYLKMGQVIAETHHERWDGSGYPAGLMGSAIPIEGRIVNIVDQYDALRTRRPYKKPFTHDDAMTILRDGDDRTRPSHFDPEIRDAFLRCEARMEEIYREIADPP